MFSRGKRLLAAALCSGLLLSVPACKRAEEAAGTPSGGERSHALSTEETMQTTAFPQSATDGTVTGAGTGTDSAPADPLSSGKTAGSTGPGQSARTQPPATGSNTTPSAAASTQRQPGQPLELKPDNGAIKYTGRTQVTGTSAWLDWSGSSFEVAVTGGRVRAKLVSADNDDLTCSWIGVYVNGERTQTLRLKAGSNWVTLADGLPAGAAATVRAVKLNEAQMCTTTLQAVEVTGELQARPAEKSRRILWIGDSITAGYGVLAKPADPFTSGTQDATRTYAWLVSEALNAERHMLAVSGYGVATSNGGSTTDGLLPAIFPYISFMRGKRDSLKWDSAKFQPDLVVVNLGTNDAAGGSPAARLRDGVRGFLGDVRRAHPRARIVWMYGFMIDTFQSDIRQEVEAFAAADGNARFIPLARMAADEVGSGHPNAAAHAKLAAALTPEIKALMKW